MIFAQKSCWIQISFVKANSLTITNHKTLWALMEFHLFINLTTPSEQFSTFSQYSQKQ